MQEALQIITDHARAYTSLRDKFFAQNAQMLAEAAFATALSLARGGKLLLCGNGGSAADAQHVAGEFVNRFLVDRPALAAIALTTDTSVLTAIANDDSFSHIFARQVQALGQPGDILFAISTSGNSLNVIKAVEKAKEKKMQTIGLTGQGGGQLGCMCDWLLAVPSKHTPLVQEAHLACEHIFCQLCDYFLFENPERIGTILKNSKPE